MSNTSTAVHRPRALDRDTPIQELATAVKLLIRKSLFPAIALVIYMGGKLYFDEANGAFSVFLMGAAAIFCLQVWRHVGIGLPILPIIAVQHFAVYALPLFTQNSAVLGYSSAMIDQSGVEVAVFLVAVTIAWVAGIQMIRSGQPHAYTLTIFASGHINRTLNRVGVALITASAGYEVCASLGLTSVLFQVLPAGTFSIIAAVVNATGMSGYFLVALAVGSRVAEHRTVVLFWTIWTLHCLILASGFLLSAVGNLAAAVVIGLFWGSGRFPWKLGVIVMAVFSFLQAGKMDMRARYWASEDPETQTFSLVGLPQRYSEWAGVSLQNLTSDQIRTEDEDDTSMANRVNNLQNLLYVIHAVQEDGRPTLNGATYAIIPPLLMPRILWPEKPRTHEGQVMLNVHYGRQTLESTFKTYIAWGLVPEAYGNFGPIWGVIILGAPLGFLFAWIERFTARKPLLSAEGFISFSVLLSFMLSFEMVASVLITSMFQSIMTIVIACAPFVRYTRIKPAAAGEPSGRS